jgi:hypothetical protein
MATLFQRIAGDIPQGDPDTKIRIHEFMSAFNEVRRGKMTGGEFVSIFSLSGAQVTAATTLNSLLVAAPNKVEFLRVLKDLLYLAERNVLPRYRDQTWVVSRLREEVTDNGGTLP